LFLNLEKSQYHNGQKVKGYLTITTNKDSVSRALKFIVEGKEETKITVSEPYSGSSSSYSNEYRNVTYTSSNYLDFYLSYNLTYLYCSFRKHFNSVKRKCSRYRIKR
jgi:hypothetical protein